MLKSIKHCIECEAVEENPKRKKSLTDIPSLEPKQCHHAWYLFVQWEPARGIFVQPLCSHALKLLCASTLLSSGLSGEELGNDLTSLLALGIPATTVPNLATPGVILLGRGWRRLRVGTRSRLGLTVPYFAAPALCGLRLRSWLSSLGLGQRLDLSRLRLRLESWLLRWCICWPSVVLSPNLCLRRLWW